MTLNSLDTTFAAQLETLVPAGTLARVEPRYLEEPRGRFFGQALVVARPRRTKDVATLVHACATARIGIIPYGGGTGLVGGQILPEGPIPLIISLERMSSVRAVYPQENVLICDAGATLASVREAADRAERVFPLSLASEGSAQIGGCLSTNAGGVNVLRYGNARDLCLGLEVVLPDGSISHGLKRLRKDNMGYDLKHLFMGAEGSLGIITGASLRLSPIPTETAAAFITVSNPRAALALLSMARDLMGEGINAFELIHRQGFEFLAETGPDLQWPFPNPPEWSVLVDVGMGHGADPDRLLTTLFEKGAQAGFCDDGVIAQSQGQRRAFWQVRENLPEANRRIGSISSHDISLPIGKIDEFVALAPERLFAIGNFRINCFGHLGDGNLHYNVFPAKGRERSEYDSKRNAIKQAVHDLVHEMQGSVSAEHGVGRLKVLDLQKYSDPASLTVMRSIKGAVDPLGIMNPGVILESNL